ncbi:polycystic kidney disease 2-like 1 protein isoform X1 [Homalodisca vitripennis]|uniref:polycystic kidney disease 2-like 1 protein isoform X1 n=1 Tax=Homalodisca vitripennis TaxID=197043 RepID=UPI001EECA54F|nr:polycystic kidney disease 2-like 1 protein isoform X1 [Homalodisca vitripennis]KAG8250081.1 TRP-like ion channel Pkd2 [Homalodisca vitripennis]
MAKVKKGPDSDGPGTSGEASVRKRKKGDKNEDFEMIDKDEVPEENKPTEPKKAPKIFTTREIGKRYLPREEYLVLCIREMLIYFIFIFVVALLAAGHRSKSEYYLSRVMTKLFVETKFKTLSTSEIISYNDINTLEQTWEYFNYYLTNTYWDYWYSYTDRFFPVYDEDRGIFYENKLMGRPRLRQLRVRNDSCTVPEDFKLMFANCYAEYSSSSESTDTYGPANRSVWSFESASKLKSLPITGEISTYGGGGFSLDFSDTLETTNNTIRELFQNLWLDRGSRALILQFTTYNTNENIFFTLQLLLELPPTGGVLPYYKIHVGKFLRRDMWDFVLLGFTGLFVLFVIMYTVEEVFEFLYFKWYYLSSFWNFLDLVILILSYITLGYFIYSFMVIEDEIPKLIKITDNHACFDNVNNALNSYVTYLAILFFFAAIKVLKYMNFNHSMHQMQTTLSRATKDIACFSVIFFIVFITFAQLGHLLFGSQVQDFRSFVTSVFALLRTAVGDFDYHKIENVNHFLGPVYFFAYIFFIYFILVNMFLAIIIDTYSEVRTSIRDQTKELHTGDILGRWFRTLLQNCGCGRLIAKYDEPPTTGTGPSPTEDLQNFLRRCGFTEMEIDLFFAKFDIPRDKAITQEEMRNKLLTNLQSDAAGKPQAVPEGQERDELGETLMARIRVLEDNITEVNYKIDLIDNKIDAIQQIRSRKRTAQADT